MSENSFDEDGIKNGTGPFPVFAGCTWGATQGRLRSPNP